MYYDITSHLEQREIVRHCVVGAEDPTAPSFGIPLRYDSSCICHQECALLCCRRPVWKAGLADGKLLHN